LLKISTHAFCARTVIIVSSGQLCVIPGAFCSLHGV